MWSERRRREDSCTEKKTLKISHQWTGSGTLAVSEWGDQSDEVDRKHVKGTGCSTELDIFISHLRLSSRIAE